MEKRTIYRWDLASDRMEHAGVFSIPASCHWFVVSPNGRRVAGVTMSAPPQVSLNEMKDGKSPVLAALPDNSRVSTVEFTPDGRRLLVRSWKDALRVLDSATGQSVRDLKPDPSGNRLGGLKSAFSPDGRCVALYDGRLRIREVASGKDRLSLPLPNGRGDPSFSPDGRFLVCNSSSGSDASTCILSSATGKVLARWWGKQGMAHTLAFSPDGRVLATGGINGTILLWKLIEVDGLPAKLSKEEAADFWQTLAGPDAARAHLAIAALAAAPAQAIPLIKERYLPVWKKPDAKRIAELITALDNDSFKVRERATQELYGAGPDAAEAIRQALAKNPSAEAKKRLQELRNRLSKDPDPAYLGGLRAIEVLERIGTSETIGVLRELAHKSLPMELQEDIAASLARLENRRVATSEPRP
jgi:hypothetical protein